MIFVIPVLLGLIILGSVVLTWILRRYAMAKSLLDIPNARSSHTLPTPRGGGVAIVLSFLAVTCFLTFVDPSIIHLSLALGGAGVAVAVVGFLDDHGHIAARWRLAVHGLSATWALFWLGGMPPVEIFGNAISLGWFGEIVGVLYLIWMLNLYNFMDGIDGIASVEAITSCVAVCLIYWLVGQSELVALPLMLAGAVLGFLCWNFPPARIFMGDAGSGFIGITIGILMLQGGGAEPKFLWVWLIMLGVFLVDATFTLLRRMIRGEKVYEAHRSHAYQYASRQYGAHLPVTLGVLAINVCWLLPVAVAVAFDWIGGAMGLIVAYTPLLFLAVRYQAGARERGRR